MSKYFKNYSELYNAVIDILAKKPDLLSVSYLILTGLSHNYDENDKIMPLNTLGIMTKKYSFIHSPIIPFRAIILPKNNFFYKEYTFQIEYEGGMFLTIEIDDGVRGIITTIENTRERID
jgi:hypothetical protein